MQLHRLLLATLAIFALLIGAVACGGDDGDTFDVPGGGEVSTSDELPDEFPDDFPIYDGADFQGAVTTSAQGIEGVLATWQTGDSIDDVSSFYESELGGDGDWSSTSSGEIGESAFITAEHSDGNRAAYVLIAREGDDTSILVTAGDKDDIGDPSDGDDGSGDDGSGDDGSGDDGSGDDGSGDDGSGDGGQPDAELPDEVEIDDEFPEDRVPIPSGARVTSSASTSAGGVDSYFVELYIEGEPDAVSDSIQSGLEGEGWTESFTTNQNGEYFATFTMGTDPATSESVTVTIRASDVDGYSEVTMSVLGQ
jgi:hypothetical protein